MLHFEDRFFQTYLMELVLVNKLLNANNRQIKMLGSCPKATEITLFSQVLRKYRNCFKFQFDSN